MRLATERRGQGYTEYLFRIEKEGAKAVIKEVGITKRPKGKLMLLSEHNDCLQVTKGKIGKSFEFHGDSEQILSNATAVTGYTYKLNFILEPLGFRWINARSLWEKQVAVAA